MTGRRRTPTPVPTDTDASPRRPGSDDRPWYRSAGKVVAAGLIATTFLVWVYAFSGLARRDPPDLLDDPTFAERAEAVCRDTVAEVDALPGALDAVDGPDRGRQVEAATSRYESMLGELQTHLGGTDRDTEMTTAWLADWGVLIRDRYRYAEAVTDDPAAPFLITDLGINEGLERRITRFATTNHMASCGAPGDIG